MNPFASYQATFPFWNKVLRNRLASTLLGMTIVILLALGASRLWVNSSYKVFFDAQFPPRAALEQMERDYSKSDNVLFVLAPRSGDAFDADTLKAAETLTREAWRLPRAARVDSIINFQHSSADGDDLRVQDLVPDASALDAPGRALAKQRALAEPLLRGTLVSVDGRVLGVNIRMQMPEDPRDYLAANNEVMAAVHALRDRVQAEHPGLVMHLVGQCVVTHSFGVIAEADSAQFLPLMLGVVALTLLVLLRSVAAVAVTLAVIALSIAATMGFAGWAGFQLNQVNAVAPTIILTLAVSDCMHLIVNYLHRLHSEPDRRAAMAAALAECFAPVLMTSITVAIGFYTLLFSTSPPFRETGVIVGTGVLLTFVITLLLVPPLMTWLPVKPRTVLGGRLHLGGVAQAVLRRNRAWLWGGLAVTAVFVALIPRNNLNDDTVHYFGERLPLRQAFDFTEQHLGGIYTVEFSLDSGREGAALEPAFLQQTAAFADWLREQPYVTHVTSLTEVMKRLNRNLNGDDPAHFRLPKTREQAAQHLLLYELSLPRGLELTDLVTFDKSATRLTVRLAGLQSSDVLALERAAHDWLTTHAPGTQVAAGSVTLMFAHIGQSNIDSIMEGAVLGIALIFVTMALLFRSLKFALVAVIANTLPAATAFGMWALMDGRVNLAVAAVFNVSSGIVIDDTIHLITHYLRARRNQGQSPEQAVVSAFGGAGIVLLVNTLLLVLGFAVFAGSDFQVNHALGVMTALIIGLAFLYDLLLMPGLLLLAERSAFRSPPSPSAP